MSFGPTSSPQDLGSAIDDSRAHECETRRFAAEPEDARVLTARLMCSRMLQHVRTPADWQSFIAEVSQWEL